MLFPLRTNTNKKIVSQYVVASLLNDNQIEKILNKLDEKNWVESLVYNDKTKEVSKKQLRSNKEQPLWPEEDGFPFDIIAERIFKINSEYWNFDIRYIDFSKDPPLVLKYGLNQKFDWHFDMSSQESTRKLSFTIQLSDSNDYKGGDLQFIHTEEHKSKIRQKGDIIIFPSYVWHRVTPITEGKRHALVGWIHGPAFK